MMKQLFLSLKQQVAQSAGNTHLFKWFHQGLGLIYLVAIFPLFFQIIPLIGKDGLMPAECLLKASGSDQGNILSFLQFPSLFHFLPQNATLLFLVALGCLGGLMLVLRYRIFTGALLAWMSFLSITTIGGDFFVIIIDLFLSEVGFLALFSCYYLEKHGSVPKLIDWVFRLLNFRLWFSMGVIKFYLPQDVWSDFTFFDYFFQAQPMPSPLAPAFHALPSLLKSTALIGLFIGEIVVPFFVFGNKKLRILAFLTFTLISLLIELTGNYGYFNVLSVVVALLILKDGDLRFIPLAASPSVSDKAPDLSTPIKVILVLHLVLQSIYCLVLFNPKPHSPQNHFNYLFSTQNNAFATPFKYLDYWRVCNPYGVFRGIPYYHCEIRLSGSSDSINWQPYEFRYAPSANTDYLGFYAPYYPRLDHLFFYETIAAPNYKWNPLNPYADKNNPWVCCFINKLLQNDAVTSSLLKQNPFATKPAPNFIKAEVYRLKFAEDSRRNWIAEPMNILKVYSKNRPCIAPIISFDEAMKTIYSKD